MFIEKPGGFGIVEFETSRDSRSSDVIVLLEALERALCSGRFAGRGEQSTPSTAGLAGPYPHTRGNANYEG
ncbi:hypothetical protein PUN28_004224 [Cardiocondyla obscurior]|uniref:Uncharacterized protein n=1 Tax=Cardiocondyla obscurior TaxID=286306 RepID=A0AAW2GQ49_9HYME